MTQPERFVAEGKLNREALVAELRRLLDQIVRLGRFDLSYDIRLEEPGAEVETPEVVVVFRGHDQDLLLERNAELLQALEYVALRGLRLDPRYYDRVRFDSGDYRKLRIEELKLSARVAAARVRETRQPFRFNPMPARERRIVHLVLKDEAGVRTSSDGAGEQRFVVVYPADG
jgi:spoIIIJ-associated protein